MQELKTKLKFDEILAEEVNLCDYFEDSDLDIIGETCHKGWQIDEGSRSDWLNKIDKYLELALQVVKKKNFPWNNASNIKYPLLSIAAMQFAARAYSALLGSKLPVKGKVIGFDPDGEKTNKAIRIGKHMSYQILDEMEEWEEEHDKLLIMIPIVGCAFKKTFYDPSKGRNVSNLTSPKNLCVNYHARSLSSASRISEIIELYENEIVERINRGLYRDIGIPDSKGKDPTKDREVSDKLTGQTNSHKEDESAPFYFVEQTCWMDLDQDGYKEPYKVVFSVDTQKVYRIIKCFDEESVEYDSEDVNDKKRKIIKITKYEYYTKYGFIPNPDGGFYDIGFGTLLGPINETTNTIINQLVDAGTLAVTGGGFLGRGIRLGKGRISFSPGEWKQVNNTGDDLRKGIVPLPIREPSSVLFNLLGMMVQSAKELASVTDLSQGKSPGQNQPATTSMALLEQGLQVYNSIQKRQFRSMSKEFKKLFKLNEKYLPPKAYFTVLDSTDTQGGQVQNTDYDSSTVDVMPSADPSIVSEALKMAKAQALMVLMEQGRVNPGEATKRILEAQEQPSIETLLQLPQNPPPPDLIIKEQELVVQREKIELERAQLEMTHEREWAKIMIDAEAKHVQFDLAARQALATTLQNQEKMYFENQKEENANEQQQEGGAATGQPTGS